MTFRSIDLQMSVPRAPDSAALQNQMMQKPVADQAQLNQETAKKAELERQRSVNVGEVSDLHVQDEESGGKQSGDQHRRSSPRVQETEEQKTPSEHPFKGRHIDISL
ncbi:hypothetical protein IDH44_08660 [Paenibacillus sp. IB182496]|uniref:Uncharacterized protein n=1 Tax=Paenibacillus sabuli TaxID=2772509 RepID=A0A927BT91_9BACL|nr:hypothetical protein [Paenibacillus sabuli]MBD2845260.1 hypothetical protein [Paenibacillus sabuli]